jgi:hypothetical protein
LADQSFLTAESAVFGAFARELGDRRARQKNLGRTLALLAVALVHLVLISLLVIPPTRLPVAHPRPALEVPLILAPISQPATAPPKVINAKPKEKERAKPIELPTPITILPPPPQATSEPNALRALGTALSCGASRYEYLSVAEKKLCHRAPWTMPKDKSLFAVVPPPIELSDHLTGAEAEARIRDTASPCPPTNTGLPCIDEIIHGKGPH